VVMRRRDFITLVGGATVTWPLAALAQETGRTYRLGGVAVGPRTAPYFISMFDELRRLGFIEGQNLTIDWRAYGPRVDLIPEFVAGLVKAHVDVIYATGDLAIRAAQQATTTIPILGATEDMVGSGLVNSLAHPGGNTTGLSVLATELDGKRQEILIEAVPGIRRMAAIADTNTIAAAHFQALQYAARARGVELSIHRITRPEEIPAAIDAAKASDAAALNVLESPIFYGNRQIIMQSVAALRLPAIYSFPEEAEEGGFAAYGPRLFHMYELMAPQLVKLLRGAKAADLPVEQPTKFELWINLKTANATGVTVPPALLVRADKVIE
jgi:putative tryptophan/tyrosine transport system substrate-binding protein